MSEDGFEDGLEDSSEDAVVGSDNVVALNGAAQIFDALADSIYGSAVGWPPGAIEKLAVALVERYEPTIGEAAVTRLLILAQHQPAA